MEHGFHPPLEEYLKAIHSLSEEGVEVIQARLVERLDYSAQAVSEMVHRLADEGYVLRVGRGVQLSDAGRARAESVVRKHRLAERFLVDILGLEWHQAHLEAGRWEHVISDDVEARFIALLGYPRTCPHGNPIPGMEPIDERQYALSELDAGAEVTLARITEKIETNLAQLVFLSDHGLKPGRQARVAARREDGQLVLELDADSQITLDESLSRELYVTAR